MSSVSSRSISSSRTPELPLARQLARKSIVARVTSGEAIWPVPAPRKRSMFCCSARGLLGRDLAVRAVAEPGRDAVDRDLAGDQVLLERARRLDAPFGLRREDRASTAAGELDGLGDRERSTVKVDVHAGGLLEQIRHVTKVPRYTNLATNLGDLLSSVQRRRFATVQLDQRKAANRHGGRALLHSFARNHALVDGSKRLAWLGTYVFLAKNGVELAPDDDTAYDFMISVADGTLDDLQSIADVLGTFV